MALVVSHMKEKKKKASQVFRPVGNPLCFLQHSEEEQQDCGYLNREYETILLIR